jgi:transposase
VYKGTRPNKNFLETVPVDVKAFHNDSGSITQDLFFKWMEEIFHPWLVQKGYLKVVLTMDNHSSHVSLKASEFARKNNIRLLCILPNASQILQPLDVGVFKPL